MESDLPKGNLFGMENLYTSFVDNRVDKPRVVLKKSYTTNVRLLWLKIRHNLIY